MKTKSAALVLALLTAISVAAVPGAFKAEAASAAQVQYFLDTVGPMCTADMRDNHILASFSMAQAIEESGWGTSNQAVYGKNLFGITASSGNWGGKVYYKKNVYSSYAAAKAAVGSGHTFWRAYDSWQESVADHSRLFNTASRYENLRENYSFSSCALLVVQDGYIDDPKYTTRLTNHYNSRNLAQYDYDFSVPPVSNFTLQDAYATAYVADTASRRFTGLTDGISASALAAMFVDKVKVYGSGGALLTGSAAVGTGCYMESEDGKDICYVVVQGDVNGSGTVDGADYAALKSHLKGMLSLKGLEREAADLSADRVISAADCAVIGQRIAQN